jgi:hypothetical protein
MTFAIRLSSLSPSSLGFCRAFLSRYFSFRLSLLAKGVACLLLLCSAQSWASFTILFNGVVTTVNTGSFIPNNPGDIAVDAAGNAYFVDTFNNRVVKIAANGTSSLC